MSPQDPSLAQRSPKSWLRELGHHEPTRIAESGAILIGGFVAAVVLLYAFAWLAFQVLEQETQAVDLATLQFLQQFSSPQLTLAATAVSLLGNQFVWVLSVVLLMLFIVQRRWGAAATLIIVTAGVQVLNDILKDAFHRTRPTPVTGFIDAQQFSFPSGHAMVAAAFYLYVAYVCWNLLSGRWRGILAAGLVVLVLAIGVARLYLEAHYLSDVIAGYMAGVLWTDAVILGSRVLADRSWPRRHR